MKNYRTLLIKILGVTMIIFVLKSLIVDKSEDYFWIFLLLILCLILVFTPSHIYFKNQERREKTFSIMGTIGRIVGILLIAALSYFTDIPRPYIFLGIVLLVVIWAICFELKGNGLQ